MVKIPMKGTKEYESFCADVEHRLGRKLTRKDHKALVNLADRQRRGERVTNDWDMVTRQVKSKGINQRPEYHEHKVIRRGKVKAMPDK